MSSRTSPEYVDDAAFAEGYRTYQRRYAAEPRESDKVLIDLVRTVCHEKRAPHVLDVGCSTGNLLKHLRAALPDARLVGGDLMDAHLDEARRNPELSGVAFRRMDLLDLDVDDQAFDAVIANAVVFLFDDLALERALAGVRRALRPGGAFVAFDFAHPYEQELTVRETSATHPEGLTLHLRSESGLGRIMERAGLRLDEVRPFLIGIDLPRPADHADIGSHTVAGGNGQRLLFRGALFQPWAHIVARREA